MARVEGVEIKALCDIVPARVNESIDSIKEYGHSPESFTQNKEDWKRLCYRDDIDLVVISTPWSLHTPQINVISITKPFPILLILGKRFWGMPILLD